MPTKPLKLKGLSVKQLQAGNMLCGKKASFASQIHGQSTRFSLAPLNRPIQPEVTLTFRIDNVDHVIQVNRTFFSDIVLGDTHLAHVLDQLPESLLLGSLHIIFERTLNDLRAMLQKDIQLIDVTLDAEDLPSSVAVVIEMNEQHHYALLGVNAQNKEWIEKLPSSAMESSIEGLPVNLVLEVGRTTLSSSQVGLLKLGDIIFLEHNWHHDRSHLFIKTSGNRGFLGTLTDTTVLLKSKMEAPMNDDHDEDLDDFDDDLDQFDDDLDDLEPLAESKNEAIEEMPAPVDDSVEKNAATVSPDIHNIPVQLTFDIGKQEIPFGNINQLVPGFTFQLNREIASPVLIHANGKPMAEGELVDINGQLGTRITRML